MVARRGQEAGDHQLPHAQAGEGRALLREDLRSDPGLGVLLRQVQAGPLQGHHLRALRRRGHPRQGAARADGPHRAGRAGHAHLVLQGCAEPAGLPARPGAEGPGEGHLLRRLHDHLRGRRGAGSRDLPSLEAQISVEREQLEQRRDADIEARQGKLEADLAELEAQGAKGDARRKVRESADREMQADPRPRGQREIDRLDEVWTPVQEPEGPGPRGRRAALPRDAGPVRPVLPRRHGRAGASRTGWRPSTSTPRPTSLREIIRTGKGQKKARALKRLKVVSRVPATPRNSPDGHGPRLHPGDPAGPAADGPARRWPVRHLRPERPVPPGDQPEQPAQAAARPRRARDHREQREADAAGGRGRAVRQRPPRPSGHRSGQPPAQVAVATCSRASRAGSARTCSASASTTPAVRSSSSARSSSCTSAACPSRWRWSCSSRS